MPTGGLIPRVLLGVGLDRVRFAVEFDGVLGGCYSKKGGGTGGQNVCGRPVSIGELAELTIPS
jgi:hypothetical protein